MNLLLQLNGDLPGRFPGHDRRLYVWACRRKACRRKDGSVRGFRATRQTAVKATPAAVKEQPPSNLGETLFGVKSTTTANANLFAAPGGSSSASTNPFATASILGAKPPQKPTDSPAESLPQTFADKARLASPPSTEAAQPTPAAESWPEKSTFPEPYPAYYVDADKEYIDASPEELPRNVQVDNGEGSSNSAGEKDMKDAFESSMDKTFQKFADRLSQNPEQVLRYEYDGQPLLYSKKDKVGKLLDPPQSKDAKVKTSGSGKIPRCTNCGAERVFELQLTPHGIAELEAEEMSFEGMDWGTILLGVCSNDCQERGKKEREVGYVQEWIGVQWEEMETNNK